MEKEKDPTGSSVDQSEKAPGVPYPLLVGLPAIGLITDGVLRSNEKEIIAGVGLLGLEVAVLFLEKRFEVKKRN